LTGADEFRTTAAQLIDCSADCIAIVPSASYASRPAREFAGQKSQSILVLEEQFPSNYYPWQRRGKNRRRTWKIVRGPKIMIGPRPFSIPLPRM